MDRCYMTLTCRRCDAAKFLDEHGFYEPEAHVPEPTPDSPIVDLIDDSHAADLPTDLPYYGHYGAAGNYGAHNFACDGQTFCEVEVSDVGNGYVVELDTELNLSPGSRKSITEYQECLARAKGILETYEKEWREIPDPAATPPAAGAVPFPDAPPKHCPYCGGSDIVTLEYWMAVSNEDPGNTARVTEYQCRGQCQHRSFWA